MPRRGAAAEVIDPKGERLLSLAEGTRAENIQFTDAGFYEIHRPNGPDETVAVNADRQESDLAPAPPETLALWRIRRKGPRGGGGDRRGWYKSPFAMVVCDDGGLGAGHCRIACWEIGIYPWIKRRHETIGSLSEYLGLLERRMRRLALTRGAAVAAGVALGLTMVAVLATNHFAFSDRSVTGARVFLFLGLAFAMAAALIVPAIRLNRRRAARAAERQLPGVRGAPAHLQPSGWSRTRRSVPAPSGRRYTGHGPRGAAADVARTQLDGQLLLGRGGLRDGTLIWLATAGPGFLGYGTSLLWGGLPKGDMKPLL